MSKEVLRSEAINFFLYSYFGIYAEDNVEKMMLKCASRAYLDLNRTIKFNEDLKEKEGQNKREKDIRWHCKKQFREEIAKGIVNKIEEKIKETSGAHQSWVSDKFNQWHHGICSEIKKKALNAKCKWEGQEEISFIEDNKFTYGQAQKWLNMTLKYMWLLDLLPREWEKLLHAPVDSFILEAATKEGIPIPSTGIEELQDYKESKVLKWSKWDNIDEKCEEYSKFQERIEDLCSKNNNSVIQWEGKEWIEVAKEREKNRLPNSDSWEDVDITILDIQV